ncbi:3-hydroxy-9,10-secoandrosta-1,3,5(10)-triene-9,17-dione monooxygenase oxygenase subunit [Nocardioides daejeonensis]|uniref:3-hydroxy-9,10-secoandrosta-1,3,5(10)-triene-9, 17-dione monooxygenase oxygenase subunit n=1 Tax=Nocardioides daejeonensis TaxID=1046556 RepID=UPI000D742C6C|nr:3-hydroxy-9,10-secoandrosta-1,3,5(10)-triene-9,17-dione monooxygenase oxygenase subunit [Nocardioides daejeonensis]
MNDVLAEVRTLLPGFRERAAATEDARRIPEESIAELRDAGVFRMLQPHRYGGLEEHPTAFYEVVRAISGACGSTGWVASVMGVHPWQLALFPEAAQEDVWGDDPDALLASSYAPVGRLTEVDGGYRLSGRWSFSSGCDHASWLLLGALVTGPTGSPVDFITTVVRRTEAEIVDVWDTIGLRGTGSNDLIVRDAFLPSYRVLRNFEHSQLRGPGQQVNTGPLYRMPFGAVFTSTVTAPILGAVQGCLDDYVATMIDRHRLSLGGGRFVEDPFAHVALARAASEIDASVLQMDRNINELHAAAEAGREIPMELRLRARRDQVRGTERALTAIDMLFKTAGGNSLRSDNPIGRAWRDAHAGSVHVANDIERTLALYGKGSFGIPVEDNLV